MYLIRQAFLAMTIGLITHPGNAVENTTQSITIDDEAVVNFHTIYHTARSLFSQQEFGKAQGLFLQLLEHPYISFFKHYDEGLYYAELMTFLGGTYYEEGNNEKGDACWKEAAIKGHPTILVIYAEMYMEHPQGPGLSILCLERAIACNHLQYRLDDASCEQAIIMLAKLHEQQGNIERATHLRAAKEYAEKLRVAFEQVK